MPRTLQKCTHQHCQFESPSLSSQFGVPCNQSILSISQGRCGWRGYEREEKEGEREVDNLSTCGCVIQLYLWENTRFIEIREFGWGFLMLTS